MMGEIQKRYRLFVFAAALLGVLFAGGVEKSYAIEYEFLGAKPAYPDPDVENSKSWFIYNLNPGESIEDGVIAMNLFKDDLDVLIYAADSIRSSSGGFAFKQYVESKEQLGSWLKFYPNDPPEWFGGVFEKLNKKIIDSCALEKEAIEEKMGDDAQITQEQYAELKAWCEGVDSIDTRLASKEKRLIPFVFTIPDDPSLDVGEHTGAIAIQKKAPEIQEGGVQSSVRLTMRLGVRIYQTIPGEIIKELSLENVRVDKNYKELDYSSWFKKDTKPENYIFSVEANNIQSNVSVLFDEKTRIESVFPGGEPEESERSFQVLRGDAFISNFSWQNPRFGKFIFSKEVSYENTNGEMIILKTEPISILILPWREILAACIFLGFVAVAVAFWKVRAKKLYGGIGWQSYSVQEGDDINNLSEAYQVEWLVLAKTNKLKPPYKLEVGQSILLPPSEGIEVVRTSSVGVGDDAWSTPVSTSASSKSPFYSNWVVWVVVGVILLGIIVFAIIASNNKKTVSLETKISAPQMAPSIENGITEEDPNMIMKEDEQEKIVDLEDADNIQDSVEESTGAQGESGSLDETMEEIPDEEITESDNESEADDTVIEGESELHRYAVQILNGGAPDGSAGKTARALEARGFEKVSAANAPEERTGHIVYYKESGEEIVEKFSQILEQEGVKVEKVENTNTVEQYNAVFILILGA